MKTTTQCSWVGARGEFLAGDRCPRQATAWLSDGFNERPVCTEHEVRGRRVGWTTVDLERVQ